MATTDSSGLLVLKDQKEIIEGKSFEEKFHMIFQEEYNENIEDILILEEEIFIRQIKDGVLLLLEENYPQINLSDEKIINLISQNMDEIQKQYNHDFSLINKEWLSYSKIAKRRTHTENLLKGFRKHCINTEDFASHNCCPIKEIGKKNENCHFICVYNSDIKRQIKFVICELCKKVYYSNYILSLCNKCNIEYYTSLLSPEENPDMLLATWDNYHCPELINEKMKCIKCREYFYLNMKNGLLTCLNKNCEFISKPSRILWTCIVCKKDFQSGVRPYNPLDLILTKKLVQQTILLRHKAYPTKLPCCNLNPFFIDFFHKSGCNGKLYQSEFNDKTIIVCEKCLGVNYIERFKWTCPKCGKRFREKNNNNNLNNNNKNNNSNSDNKNTFYSNKDENNKKGKEYLTPKISISKRRRFKSHIEQELEQFKLDEVKTNTIFNKKEIKEESENQNGKETMTVRRYRKFRKDNDDNDNNNEENVIKKNPTIIGIVKNVNNNKNEDNNDIIKKAKTNMGGFRRYTTDNTFNKDKKDDKQNKNSFFEVQQKKENLSPRLMWKKRKQEAAQNKKNILELYTMNSNKKEEKVEKEAKKEEILEKEGKNEENVEKEDKKDEKEKIIKNEPQIIIINKEEESIKKQYPKSPSPKRRKYNLSDISGKIFSWNEPDIEEKTEKTEKETTQNSENLIKNENSEEENENIEDTMANLILKEEENEEDSPKNDKVMSIIPGVSENLYNMINKRINAILEKCKIPVFNVEDYLFDKKLGEGGYAAIFAVYKIDDESYKKFAMKKIIAYSLDEIENFTKEFELVYSCVHPNIMKIYGLCIKMLDQTTYSLYVLMEKSKRDWDADIKRHLKKKKNYSENELISILYQLSDALLFMQKKLKISHRDIKPQNVLVFGDGIYKIADFGEAKEMKINKEINTLKGTELYMSPALYLGLKNNSRNVNHDPYKSDVFSLGFCFLYAAALNFKLLYQVREVYNSNQMNQILNQQLKKKYSETFINILANMLEIEESKRYDFSQLIEVIKENYDKNGNLKNIQNNI